MFDDIKNWLKTTKLEKVKKSLIKNGFKCEILSSNLEVKDYLLKNVKSNMSIGFGGSVTVRELEIDKILKENGNKLFNHWDPDLQKDEKFNVIKNQITSDLFITSSNAITIDGKLVNIDGTGNRVASMIFGPKIVFVFAGINKITDNLDDALKRVKDIACPLNSQRIGLSTPCSKTGECYDCKSEQRMCNVTTIIEKRPPTIDYRVILLNRELGF